MVLPALLLHKLSKTSKANDRWKMLGERLEAWKERHLNKLLQECRTIQKQLSSSVENDKKGEAKSFAKPVFQRKINAAIKLLSNSDVGVHKVDENKLYELRQKQPQPAPYILKLYWKAQLIVFCYHILINRWDFDLKSSQYDISGWWTLTPRCKAVSTSEKYNQENKELLVQLATLAKAMATNILHPKMLEALVAYRNLPFLSKPWCVPDWYRRSYQMHHWEKF